LHAERKAYAYDAATVVMTHSGASSFSVAFRNHYKFTGKERDSESGLDNFGARYDASSMGRFRQGISGTGISGTDGTGPNFPVPIRENSPSGELNIVATPLDI
jgi:hypothetical protein